jgi:hypothetical protein
MSQPPRRIPDPGFAGDDGRADPELAAALSAARADPRRRPEVLAALHRARVLAPVVAVLGPDGRAVGGGEKSSDIAVPLLGGADGARALPVFTSLDTLRGWDPAARPVPVLGPQAAQVALDESAEALVVDPASPGACALGRPEVQALAEGRAGTPAYADEELASALRDALVTGPVGITAQLHAAYLRPGADVDAQLLLVTVAGTAAGTSPTGRADLGRLLGELLAGVPALRERAVLGLDLVLQPSGSPLVDDLEAGGGELLHGLASRSGVSSAQVRPPGRPAGTL